jgi:hypothetical protein
MSANAKDKLLKSIQSGLSMIPDEYKDIYIGRLSCYGIVANKMTFFEYLDKLKKEDIEKNASNEIQRQIEELYEQGIDVDSIILEII